MRHRLVSSAATLLAALFAASGCGESSAPESSSAAPNASAKPAPAPDAAPSFDPAPAPAPEPSHSAARIDPDFHLDPDPEPSSRPGAAPGRRQSRPIELILRSTPPGATASVDGHPIGKTPTFWAGNTDGRPRDVTFALPGYAVARYRFVATRSGVVHGSLRKLTKAEPEPGFAPAAERSNETQP